MFKFAQKKSNKENEQNRAETEENETIETEEKHEELDLVKENGEENIGKWGTQFWRCLHVL